MPITPVQSSYSQSPREAFPGMLADAFGPTRVKSRFGRGLLKAGFGVFRSSSAGTPGFGAGGTDPGEVFHIPSPPAAVSAAALHSGASATTQQVITAFNGLYGAAELQPPRQATFAFSASGWSATTGTLVYVNENGLTVTESVSIANSGTPTTTGRVKRLVSFTIPVQGGAAGTFTMGVVALASLTEALFDGVAINQDLKRSNSSSALYGYPGMQGVVTTANYQDGDSVPVLSEGGIWVYTETAVTEGDPVYIRTAINGNLNILGAFANAAGTGLTQLTKAAWARDASFPAQGETSNGCAWLRLSYL